MRKNIKKVLFLIVILIIPKSMEAIVWQDLTITDAGWNEPTIFYKGPGTVTNSGILTNEEEAKKRGKVSNLTCDNSTIEREYVCKSHLQDKPFCKTSKWSKENPNPSTYEASGRTRKNCSWGEQGTKLDNPVAQDVYEAVNSAGVKMDSAYCLDPHTPFGKEKNGYKFSEAFDLSNCKTSNQSQACAWAGVFYKAEEKGSIWKYQVVNTAIRFVAAHYNDQLTGINAAAERVKAYQTTEKAILSGKYIAKSTPGDNYILYAKNAISVEYLKEAAAIYKEVMDGFKFERKTAKISTTRPYDYDPDKKILIFNIETNYDLAEISNISVNSLKHGDLTAIHNHNIGVCTYDSKKNCLFISVPYDKDLSNGDKIDLKLSLNGVSDVPTSIARYTYIPNVASSPSSNQRFLVYDKSSSTSLEYSVPINPESHICTVEDGKYYGINGNLLGEGTAGYNLFRKECHCITKDDKYYVDYPTEVTRSEYDRVCNPGTTTCDPKITYNMPGDCENDGTEGTISDPSICNILSSEKTKANYKVSSYGNEYCDVYCRETLNFTFMDKETAIAGRYFKHDVASKYSNIEYLSTVILSSRQCFSITDYNKWETAYIAANNKVLTEWNAYKADKAKADNVVSHNETKWCNSCSSKEQCYQTHTCSIDDIKVPATDTQDSYIDHTQKHWVSGSGCSARSKTWTWYDWTATYEHTNSDGSTTTTDVSGSSGGPELKTNTSCSCSGCGTCIGNGGTAPTYSKTDYNKAVSDRNKLVDKINSCNFVEGSNTYIGILGTKLNNNVDIDYEENTTYNKKYDISIKNTTTAGEVVKRGYGSSSDYKTYCSDCYGTASNLSETSDNKHLTYWDCSESSGICTDNTNIEFPTNKAANIVVEKESLHYQGSQFYTQVYTGNVSTTKNNVGYWITMDPHIYPVDINRKTDSYGIELEYSNLGSNRNKNVKFKSGEFTCSYQVINDLNVYDCDDGYHICYPDDDDKKGFGLYFRSIDLEDVFPNSSYSPNYKGTNKSVRQVGVNWKTGNAPQIVEDIQKLGNDIWEKEPRYVITLTPSMINAVKKYNKTTSYLDYSIKCNNLSCSSEFLTDELKDIMGNKYSNYYSKDVNIKLNSLYYYKR